MSDIEQQALGGLMVRPSLRDVIRLSPDDFLDIRHREIAKAVYSLGELDALRVVDHLRNRGRLDVAGGAAYVMGLASDVFSESSTIWAGKKIQSKRMQKELEIALREMANECASPILEDESEWLGSIEARVLDITSRRQLQGIRTMSQFKAEAKEYVRTLMQSGGLAGLPTGFQDIDRLTTGLVKGCLYVLAARPGLGKTTLAMNIAANVAMKFQRHVLVFSLEMSYTELFLRLLSSDSRVDLEEIRAGRIGGREKRILESLDEITKSRLAIDETGALDVGECVARARRFQAELMRTGESLSIVIVDYLQLLCDKNSRRDGRQNEVAGISRSLKHLAKSLNCPVLAVAQTNRDSEKHKRKPQLSDLRESGAIEADADLVAFLHRDQEDGSMEFLVRKNRHGATAEIPLEYFPASYTFRTQE